MPNLQSVPKESLVEEAGSLLSPTLIRIMQWAAGVLLLFVLGSWLVWLALYLQHKLVTDEIRGACQRVMPETVERCVDTVIIQRGGARR